MKDARLVTRSKVLNLLDISCNNQLLLSYMQTLHMIL